MWVRAFAVLFEIRAMKEFDCKNTEKSWFKPKVNNLLDEQPQIINQSVKEEPIKKS